MKTNHWMAALCAAALLSGGTAMAQTPQTTVKELPAAAKGDEKDKAAALAQKLTNPVADLISVPFQFNWNGRIGPANKGQQAYMNFQRLSRSTSIRIGT